MASMASSTSGTLPAPPPLGFPVPNTLHAVSVQLPYWKDMCDFAQGVPRVKDVQQSGYPRSFIHFKIRELATACLRTLGLPHETCLLFPARQSASACADFLTSPTLSKTPVAGEAVRLRCIEVDVDGHEEESGGPSQAGQAHSTWLHAVFFPKQNLTQALTFWRLTGTGISSRVAERSLWRASRLREVDAAGECTPAVQGDGSAYDRVRTRIAQLLERAPRNPARSPKVAPGDVFLYQTGMSAIYELHQFLLRWRGTQTVVFGFPYELTLKMIETYGPSCKFFGFGVDTELDELEAYLQAERTAGRPIQAVWCECPSNPLLRTVDLDRIRRLADEHGFVVVVDETIGSFANVDLLDVADFVVTSLTKSFSGYSDVMGGSVVLNPASPFYALLKPRFDAVYRNDLCLGDAVHLERNSRDFLARAAQINRSAGALVGFLHPFALSSSSTVAAVYYPQTCWSVEHYRARMRPATHGFTPGFGGLFTVEFTTVAAASVFFDALNVHKGPSLGANLTLAQPYVQTVFTREKEWAARFGLQASIVRISVGLEATAALVEAFAYAVGVADESAEDGTYDEVDFGTAGLEPKM